MPPFMSNIAPVIASGAAAAGTGLMVGFGLVTGIGAGVAFTRFAFGIDLLQPQQRQAALNPAAFSGGVPAPYSNGSGTIIRPEA